MSRKLRLRGVARANNVRFSRVSSYVVPEMSSGGGFNRLNISDDGNSLYGALDVDGVGIFDISDLTNITTLDVDSQIPANFPAGSSNHRNFFQIDETTAVSCTRNSTVGLTGPNGAGSGFIQTWDITGNQLTLLDTFNALDVFPAGNPRYSDMAYDRVNKILYVAGRRESITSFDLSDRENIQLLDRDLDTVNWETHGIALANGYALWPNYGNNNAGNVRVTPIDENGNFGTPINTGQFIYKTVKQRAFHPVIDGNHMFCSLIETTSRGQSGLAIYDISDLSQALPLVGHAPLPNMLGTSHGSGDEPNNGLNILNDEIYLANGDRGVAVINVSDRTKPLVRGTFGLLPKNENIKSCVPFVRDSKTYCLYASGSSIEASNYNTIYIDQVIFP